MYDAMGNMSVQIMQPNRAALADVSARQRAEDEGRAAFDGYLGYYGTYRILPHEQTIIHHLTGSSLAHWDGAQVVRWDPQTAAPLASIKVPVTRPTSCVFGGEDFGTLYITSASTRLSAESVATQPLAGSLFSCRPGVTGLPMWEFAG
jgi:hypothetical protein